MENLGNNSGNVNDSNANVNAKLDVTKKLLNLLDKGKTTTKSSINELIVKVLQDPSKALTRVELVNEITILRYEEANNCEITNEMLESDEFVKEFQNMAKTVKNGVDTSISHSNNNSSFHFNENFKMWNLSEKSGKYSLTKVEAKK